MQLQRKFQRKSWIAPSGLVTVAIRFLDAEDKPEPQVYNGWGMTLAEATRDAINRHAEGQGC